MSWLQGKRVCFTGKGHLNGKLITRDRLEAYVNRSKGRYTEKSPEADILVASRTDTIKAINAQALGKNVITYDEFWQMCGITLDIHLNGSAGGPPPPTPDGYEHPYDARDREAKEARERLAVKKAERKELNAAMDQAASQIEGWGSF